MPGLGAWVRFVAGVCIEVISIRFSSEASCSRRSFQYTQRENDVCKT